ncbi:hypothetical protein WJX72_005709 [[Myrmecia] bisecta]|uniref:UDP-galactose transporter n=1 Tax=[Myrmecia] bisecta TaxID=41462 RepID=A0AAW1Q4T4_9CHLO
MVYSVLQERIMTEPYGTEGEVFKFSFFLVLCNRLLTASLAVACLLVHRQDVTPVAPFYSYAAISMSNVVATTCQYEALKFVSFPVQTLGKCAKMIPVMVWGTLIMRKRYGKRDYALAVLITAGCAAFAMTGSLRSKRAAAGLSANLYGLALMLGYLAFDGFTSTFQDKLFRGYQMTIYNQILYVNLFSALFSFLGLLTSGQVGEALSFVLRHPESMGSIFMLSLAATTGQLFIVHTIKTFGALLFATVMTTRQFLSILVSCALFGHPLTLGQWAGTSVVFGVLYYKTIASRAAKLAGSSQPLKARVITAGI